MDFLSGIKDRFDHPRPYFERLDQIHEEGEDVQERSYQVIRDVALQDDHPGKDTDRVLAYARTLEGRAAPMEQKIALTD